MSFDDFSKKYEAIKYEKIAKNRQPTKSIGSSMKISNKSNRAELKKTLKSQF